MIAQRIMELQDLIEICEIEYYKQQGEKK